MKKASMLQYLFLFGLLSFYYFTTSSQAAPKAKKASTPMEAPGKSPEVPPRSEYDQSIFLTNGTKVSYRPDDISDSYKRVSIEKLLSDSGLESHVFYGILEDAKLGFESTYLDGQIRSKFIPAEETIAFNQLESSQVEEDAASFEESHKPYTAEAFTFAESVTTLFRNFLKDHSDIQEANNQRRMARLDSEGQRGAALQIAISQANMTQFTATFVSSLAQSDGKAPYNAIREVANRSKEKILTSRNAHNDASKQEMSAPSPSSSKKTVTDSQASTQSLPEN